MYGIWIGMKKEFQFGIAEETKKQAKKKLFNKIGYDALKWRFETKKLPDDHKLASKSTSVKSIMFENGSQIKALYSEGAIRSKRWFVGVDLGKEEIQ